ncbi:hypothetical protein [Enterobacter kobei]|uniref:hypothetical protein n=1 Tax=Enterobacter kobei TaxID=208224 RepID=UPI00124D5FFD|nr:hypothetical protein [Enterobacter kobei]QFH91400.1 hypothetical protein FR825_17185 [Enterobacter kobei]
MSSREQFEAWWEVNYHNGQPPRHGWEFWRDGEGYSIEGDEEFQWRWEAWQAATNAMEAKCAALAAKGMEVVREASLIYSKYNDTQMPDRDIVDQQTLQELYEICTADDSAAFLAEVRAQGVEMLVKHCEQKALEKSYDFFMDAGAVAAQFAAQLRQEAQ